MICNLHRIKSKAMRNSSLGALALFAVLILSETPAAAQIGVPAVGGIGDTAPSRPRRRLHKNTSPALSPALNLVPGVAGSFGGQFLLRQLPQEQFLKANAQATKNFERLENQIGEQQLQIKTGLGRSGHSVSYLNYGSYYQMGAGGSHNGVGGRRR
jgi:hypothetical protein